MEELVLLPVLLAAAVAVPIAMFFADLAGLAMGYGWKHYSKKRRKLKAEKKKLEETFE